VRGWRDGLAAALGRGGEWFSQALLRPDCPLLSLEVRPGSIGAIRFRREGRALALETAASLELPEGTLRLSLSETNVVDGEGFRRSLGALIERVGGPPPGGRVCLVLPDPVARVRALPGEEVRGRGAKETEEMIRFRLRRLVPFDAREARISNAFSSLADGEERVVVAAMSRAVVEEYEDAAGSLGLDAGIVDLSGLALQGAASVAPPPGDWLLVNWEQGYVSFILSRGSTPLLIRTLTEEVIPTPDEVLREAASTVLYYSEKLGGPGLSMAVVRSVALPPEEAGELLREPLGLTPETLRLPRCEAAIPSGLAGAAGCVLSRAA
jgi:hypothetical protein